MRSQRFSTAQKFQNPSPELRPSSQSSAKKIEASISTMHYLKRKSGLRPKEFARIQKILFATAFQ